MGGTLSRTFHSCVIHHHGLEEEAQLSVDLRGIADCGGDFGAEEVAISLAQAVNPGFEGALRDSELGG
jgi:hypothetical protein